MDNIIDDSKIRFGGLDLSLTGTGATLINCDGETVRQYLISTSPKMEIEDRFEHILNHIAFIWEEDVQSIFIEGLSFMSKGQAVMQLAGLHFFVRYFLKKYTNVKSFEVIPPTTLKKFVTGKGNAKKELMLMYCFKKYGMEFTDNNLCDSYLLARMALQKFVENK